MLGLEEEIAIRVHVCSKALASTGGELSNHSGSNIFYSSNMDNSRNYPLQQNSSQRPYSQFPRIDIQWRTLIPNGGFNPRRIQTSHEWSHRKGTMVKPQGDYTKNP
jgi:hypothetical protein